MRWSIRDGAGVVSSVIGSRDGAWNGNQTVRKVLAQGGGGVQGEGHIQETFQ